MKQPTTPFRLRSLRKFKELHLGASEIAERKLLNLGPSHILHFLKGFPGGSQLSSSKNTGHNHLR